MPIARFTPSSVKVSNTTYVQYTDIENAYSGVDSETYATFTTSRSSTTAYYVYLSGMNLSSLPEHIRINSVHLYAKARQTGFSASSQYCPVFYYEKSRSTYVATPSNFATLTNETTTFEITQSSSGDPSFDTIKKSKDIGVRFPVRRSSASTKGYLYVYGVELVVDYDVYDDYSFSAVGDGCELYTDNGPTVWADESIDVTIAANSVPSITDNGVDVSGNLVDFSRYATHIAASLDMEYTVDSDMYYSCVYSNPNGYTIYPNMRFITFDLVEVKNIISKYDTDATIEIEVLYENMSKERYAFIYAADGVIGNASGISQIYKHAVFDRSEPTHELVSISVKKLNSYANKMYVYFYENEELESGEDAPSIKFRVKRVFSPGLYSYQIPVIDSDHEIVVTAERNTNLHVKRDGEYIPVESVYKKENGEWVERFNMRSVFSEDGWYYQNEGGSQ